MASNRLVVGNWKMNGLAADLAEISAIADAASEAAGVDVGLCVPATLIERAASAVPGFAIGAQDVHQKEKGAHTGCLSAAMLLDAGAAIAIVGHSERREAHGESNGEVRAKAEAGLRAGLTVILCVGESLELRDSGEAVGFVSSQLEESLPRDWDKATLAVAYEPIWAIGTGRTATMSDIAEMHAALRKVLVEAYGDWGASVRVLYGGSVNASNAAEIFGVNQVGGALVGGASLKAADFIPIVEAAASAG